jgi:hypothetical protein
MVEQLESVGLAACVGLHGIDAGLCLAGGWSRAWRAVEATGLAVYVLLLRTRLRDFL